MGAPTTVGEEKNAESATHLEGEPGPVQWIDTVLPGDFASFNFAPLEENERLLTQVGDARLHERGSTPTRILRNTELFDRQREIDAWMQDRRPKLHVSIAPAIRNAMLHGQELCQNRDDIECESSFRNALTGLVTTWCRMDEQLARAELSPLDQPADGVGRRNIEVVRGDIAKCIDFSSH